MENDPTVKKLLQHLETKKLESGGNLDTLHEILKWTSGMIDSTATPFQSTNQTSPTRVVSAQPSLLQNPFTTTSNNPFGTLQIPGNAAIASGGGTSFGSMFNPSTGPPPAFNPPQFALGRRTSVSAESLVPQDDVPMSGGGSRRRSSAVPMGENSNQGLYDTSATRNGSGDAIAEHDEEEDDDDSENPSRNSRNSSTTLPLYPKSDSQLVRIKASIASNFLFTSLDASQLSDVLSAMKEVKVEQGVRVIRQGGVGDFFYVVEEGELDVYVRKNSGMEEDEEAVEEMGDKVGTVKKGGSFGELALMYNAPRAATLLTTTSCTLWSLPRLTFKTILLDHTSRRRNMHSTFLNSIPLLSHLPPADISKIADALEAKEIGSGEAVVREGEVGEEFYIIEGGEAVVSKRIQGEDGQWKDEVVAELGRGDYFGELALINRAPRAATVRCVAAPGAVLKLACLGEKAFTRLLGPIMQGSESKYRR